jgi:hypothetical protein
VFDQFALVLGTVGAAFFMVLVIPFACQRWLPRHFTMALMLTLSFVYLYMPVLAQQHNWTDNGDTVLQSSYIVLLFFLSLYLLIYWRPFLYFYVPLFFLGNTLINIYDYRKFNSDASLVADVEFESVVFKNRPDIFLLTYDAYVENETMNLYGIDNHGQEQHLEALGFKIYRGAYSTRRDSLRSMSTMMQGSDIDPQLESVDQLKKSVTGFNTVLDVLNNNDYATYNVTQPYFFPSDRQSNYDFVYGLNDELPANSSLILKALALGEFKFDIEQHGFERGSVPVENMKEEIFGTKSDRPKFLYTHSGPGHSQNSGQCRSTEELDFARRLGKFNRIMKEDIESVLALSPGSIVIVHGDHGPYLKGDCWNMGKGTAEDITREILQDRYGSFLAIRWPDQSFKEYAEISTLQDVFPSIFSYLTQDLAPLAMKKPARTSELRGVYIDDGIIINGPDNGKKLFAGSDEVPLNSQPSTSYWWNQQESGWGVSTTRLRNFLFATIFTYDPEGMPIWYSITDCILNDDRCDGEVHVKSINTKNDEQASDLSLTSRLIGMAGLRQDSSTTISISLEVGGIQQQKRLELAQIDGSVPYSSLTGRWSDKEQRQNFVLVQQSETIFMIMFTYQSNGDPVWYVISNCVPDESGCSGTVYKVTGVTPLTSDWDDSARITRAVGEVKLSFTDFSQIKLLYSITDANHISGESVLIRQKLLELVKN